MYGGSTRKRSPGGGAHRRGPRPVPPPPPPTASPSCSRAWPIPAWGWSGLPGLRRSRSVVIGAGYGGREGKAAQGELGDLVASFDSGLEVGW